MKPTLAELKHKWGGVTNILVGDAAMLPREEWELWLEELERAGIHPDTIELMKAYRVAHAKAKPASLESLSRIMEGVHRGASGLPPGDDDVQR